MNCRGRKTLGKCVRKDMELLGLGNIQGCVDGLCMG